MTTLARGKYVGGFGPIGGSKLAIVGIAPSTEELLAERPFVGPSGKLLKEDLAEAGVDLDSCYRTNVFKYKLPENEFKRYTEIGLNLNDAISELAQEIDDNKPNCILGLGDPVLFALAGKSGTHNNINQWRGSIFQNILNRKAVFTWHPAHELHGSGEGTFKSWQKAVRRFDINRAVVESQSARCELPYRLIQIARSSSDVYRFLERNKDQHYCALDIESINNVPVCIGLSFVPWEAMVVPLWNTLPIDIDNKKHPKKSKKYNLEVSTIPTPDLAYIWNLLSQFLLNRLTFDGFRINVKKIGQNFKYDEDKINKLGFYLDELFWDIQISAHCISPEMLKNLAFNTSIKTREPYYKLEGKEFVPGRDKIDDFFNYCGKDCCVTREIFDVDYKDLQEIPFGIEHATWRMGLHKAYLEVDKVGFPIDEFQRKELIHKYVNRLVALEVELWELCKSFGISKPINVRSHPQVNKLLYIDLNIPTRAGTGEEIITALLANTVKDKKKVKILENILEIRRVDKTLGYLKAEPDYDGRMKTAFLITGTENYRTSTNVLEPPIRPIQVGWAFQTVTKHGDVGQDLRSILVADKGYVIVNIDQSQAEARVCSHLAGDEKTLLEYDTIDKHAATAAKFFKGRIEQYSKKILGYECPERFVGKTLRHAYHLGVQAQEAMTSVNTDARKYKINMNISRWFANECLKELRKDTPLIETVFHAEIQRLLDYGNGRLFGTFGASRYFYDEKGSRDLYKGGYSFIPQQTVSDKTKKVLINIIKYLRDVRVVVESHDALAMMIRESVLDERIEQIQEWFDEPIDFSNCSIPRGFLRIPTEVEIGYNYKDLKPYKLRRAA